ncbi:MAG: fumarate hydratase [Proteobacteria bacterium]|nr:fumarate hydratase [Pseudomonadota bacterium]
MRAIDAADITQAVARAVQQANFELPPDVRTALSRAERAEASPLGRRLLGQIIENADLAAAERIPICQDCGLVVILAEVGQDVHVTGRGFEDALAEGVRRGYEEGYLRKSVCHPLTRSNTNDNTPIVVHTRLVPGDGLRLYVMPKGGGAENMSRVLLLTPAQGWEGVKRAVVETALEAGPNPCPPIVLGVAVGGTFDDAAVRAKWSLLRAVGAANPDPEAAALEQELLEAVNATGVGPQGLDGTRTALAVHLDLKPCHIASLPMAVNVQCHAARHVEVTL